MDNALIEIKNDVFRHSALKRVEGSLSYGKIKIAIWFFKAWSNFVEKINTIRKFLVGVSFVWKKNASAQFRARAPLDSAKRSHRVNFSNLIHNSSIFHPNNLKFWEKLLFTYMNNCPTGSFLYVKLLQLLFVGKVIKTRTMPRYNLLLNIYKKSTILSVQRILPA